jgi:hypothetical protein
MKFKYEDLASTGMIIGTIISIAGILIFFDSWQQTHFQRISGTVLESNILVQVSRAPREIGSRQSWVISVKYQYEIGGKLYTSDFYSSSPPSSAWHDSNSKPSPELESLLSQYPRGKQIDVYVSASNPNHSVLDRSVIPQWKPLFVGLFVLIISIFCYLKLSKK